MSNVKPRRSGMTFEQRERVIGMLNADMSAFPTPRIDNKSTTTDFSKLGTSQTDGDQAYRVTARRGKTLFSRLHLDAIDFFLKEFAT